MREAALVRTRRARRRNRERGASLVEYIVIVGVVALGAILAFTGFSGDTRALSAAQGRCVTAMSCGESRFPDSSVDAGASSAAGGGAAAGGDPASGQVPSAFDRALSGAWNGTKATASTALSFGKGVVVDGLWGTVKGIGVLGWSLVTHPIDTTTGIAQGIGYAITNPGEVASSIGAGIKQAWEEDPARAIGRGVFEVASIVVPVTKVGTAARAADAATDAARVADAASDAARVADAASDAAKAADAASDAAKTAGAADDAAKSAIAAGVRRTADDAAAGRRWADDALGDAPNPRNDPAALARNAENRAAYEKVMRGEMDPPPGVSRERLRLAVEGDPVTGQRIPLNFQSPEQFYRFQSELDDLLRKEGITDARVDQLGSATTGFKGNPNKPFGYFEPGSDADFAIYSDQMLDRARRANAPVNSNYGIVKNGGGMNETSVGQSLREFERRWNTELYGRPDVDGVDFKVNLPRAPATPGPDITVIRPPTG